MSRPASPDPRRLFRQLHDAEPPPPPFDLLWERARRRSGESSRDRRPLPLAAAAAAVLLLLVVWIGPPARTPAPSPTAEELELARSLSEWRTPLDFLLDAPGDELFGARPGLEAIPLPTPSPHRFPEEVL